MCAGLQARIEAGGLRVLLAGVTVGANLVPDLPADPKARAPVGAQRNGAPALRLSRPGLQEASVWAWRPRIRGGGFPVPEAIPAGPAGAGRTRGRNYPQLRACSAPGQALFSTTYLLCEVTGGSGIHASLRARPSWLAGAARGTTDGTRRVPEGTAASPLPRTLSPLRPAPSCRVALAGPRF